MNGYAYWTERERQLLMAAISQSCFERRRIDWDAVSEQVPNRSRMQCKSYYTNIMKKTQGAVQSIKYHIWNKEEVATLRRALETERDNWAAIQKKYLPGMTPAQIAAKYHYMVKQGAVKPVDCGSAEPSKPETTESQDLVAQLLSILERVQ